MGKTSQRKGRCGELELAQILQSYGYQVEPGQAVSYGSTPDLTCLPGVHIECKRAEKQSLYTWTDQARRDSEKFRDGLPAVFWRKNRCRAGGCHFTGTALCSSRTHLTRDFRYTKRSRQKVLPAP